MRDEVIGFGMNSLINHHPSLQVSFKFSYLSCSQWPIHELNLFQIKKVLLNLQCGQAKGIVKYSCYCRNLAKHPLDCLMMSLEDVNTSGLSQYCSEEDIQVQMKEDVNHISSFLILMKTMFACRIFVLFAWTLKFAFIAFQFLIYIIKGMKIWVNLLLMNSK